MAATYDQTQPTNYSRASITEAVFQLVTTEVVSEKEQKKAVNRLKTLYPHSQPSQAWNIDIDTTGAPTVAVGKSQGFRLSSDDETDIALIQNNGVVISRLAPYPGWEKFRDHAVATWTEWRAATLKLSRIGVRFINRIDIPYTDEPMVDLRDYLIFSPDDPGISSAPIQGYVIRIIKQSAMPHWLASITSTLIMPPPLLNHISLLFDIDVFRTEEIPGRDNELWAVAFTLFTVINDHNPADLIGGSTLDGQSIFTNSPGGNDVSVIRYA